MGDYLAGPSHVLPTFGTARFGGGQFSTQTDKFSLPFSGQLLKLKKALFRRGRLPQFFNLDSVVVPVQLFPKFTDPARQTAFFSLARRFEVYPGSKQFEQASGFGLLHVTPGCLARSRCGRSLQAQPHQVFVDFEPVLHEGDLQLVSMQPAPQRLQYFLGNLIMMLRLGKLARGFLDLA